MNPNDLDALDQHAPLSKPTLYSILGHVTTAGDYESYFDHCRQPHPSRDIDGRNITSEPRAIARVEKALIYELQRERPGMLVRARLNFWNSNYTQMIRIQDEFARQTKQAATQDLWGDFVASFWLGTHFLIKQTKKLAHLHPFPYIATKGARERS